MAFYLLNTIEESFLTPMYFYINVYKNWLCMHRSHFWLYFSTINYFFNFRRSMVKGLFKLMSPHVVTLKNIDQFILSYIIIKKLKGIAKMQKFKHIQYELRIYPLTVSVAYRTLLFCPFSVIFSKSANSTAI
jgi:hypothetical protein